MEYNIIHTPDKQSFETEVDGYSAHVIYELTQSSLDIIHTFVPGPIEGRGVASALVKAAYSYALEQGLRPEATCSYAVMWLKRHPEFVK